MSTRRAFLSTLSLSLAGAPLVHAEEVARRRSRWEMIASDHDIVDPLFRPDPSVWDDTTVTAAWLGHATVLVNFFGMKIITDPVLSDRVGLNIGDLFTIGPRRLIRAALTFEQLPPIDLILLSHAHLDHLDISTLKRFDRTIPVIMAKNTHDVIEVLEFETVYELDWGRWTAIGDLRVEALEVKHFGWRYPWEQDRSRGFPEGRSYNAYLLSRNGASIVFGGDTAYQEHFRALRRRELEINLAIMPIGAYDPWIHNHANPEQALAMADHMGAYHVLPIHWGTFIQSEEPTSEPIQRLKQAATAQPDRIALEAVGQSWALDAAAESTPQPAGAGPHR